MMHLDDRQAIGLGLNEAAVVLDPTTLTVFARRPVEEWRRAAS